MNKYFCEYHLTYLAKQQQQEEKCYQEGTKKVLDATHMKVRILCDEHYHELYDDVMKHGNFMATKKKDNTGFKFMYNQTKEKKD